MFEVGVYTGNMASNGGQRFTAGVLLFGFFKLGQLRLCRYLIGRAWFVEAISNGGGGF